MRYATVCSGGEAFGREWHILGYRQAFVAEIEKHASSVLRYRYPDTLNVRDFTTWKNNKRQRKFLLQHGYPTEPVRLLCGGTPCQAFSVAGLRKGLDDPRGGLILGFVKLAKRLRPQWLLWENVPGVLSADGGRAFASFLGALAECGYGFAYRVLDLQNWGVPQRRKRVFVVAYLGDWRPAAVVLFEPESLPGYPQKGSGKREGTTADATPSSVAERIIPTLCASGVGTQRTGNDRTEADFLVVPIADTLQASKSGYRNDADTANNVFKAPAAVRRLTPMECERLMGWQDEWTKHGINAKGKLYELADGPRYRICGNGWGQPVVTWIAKRIKMIDELLKKP